MSTSPLPAGPAIRLTRSDWRLIAIAIAVTAASLLVAGRYFHRAFPESSIDFQVSAAGSESVADGFLRDGGLNAGGFLHASQFDYDDDAKTFLERELGLEQAEALLRTRVRLWRWENRWFRPLTKEEFHVGVTTAGAVAGFDHAIADEAPGANLDEDQARSLAQQFLIAAMRIDPGSLTPVGVERQQKAHRTDYVFTWKDTAPLVPNPTGDMALAEYRHEVRVQGAEVGAYREYLKIPDQWTRAYERLRSKNELAGNIDSALLLILAVGMLVILVQRIRRGDVRWRVALWVGGAGAVLSFLDGLNSLGAARFAYDTTQSYSSFLADNLFSALASAIGVGVFLAVLTAAAESLYRERLPEKVSLPGLLSGRGVRGKSFFISVVLGLALAAFFFAYQTIFYLIANHFGAWAPSDINYSDILNTKLPWAVVLFGGFFPAISEEFGFRMLAIPLFEKWFRYLWIAVLAASFLWGFGHATYPNQPFFIRGLEVGLGGILLSWIMIRFGILTTVVWHYTVDAIYTAMLLLRAHNAYLRLSGGLTALIAVIPLLFAVGAYVKRGGFAPEGDLLNGAMAAAPVPAGAAARSGREEAEIPAGPAYVPVAGSAWTLGILVAAALLGAFAVPTQQWAALLPWRAAPAAAQAAATNYLRGQGYDPAGYQVALSPAAATDVGGGLGEENEIAAAGIFAKRGRRAMMGAFSGAQPTVVAEYWRVRFYRPLQKEEFSVAVRPDTGQVTGFSHTLAETAAGAAPALAEAQPLAAAFLARQGIDTSRMALKTAQQEQRPARVDSDFVWEAAPAASPLPPEVAYRVEAQLAGDRVALFHAWYHVPEARVRAYDQSTMTGTGLMILRALLLAGLAVLILAQVFHFVRRPGLPWGWLLRLSLLAGAVWAAVAANGWPQSLAGYDTSQPWGSFLVVEGISILASGLGAFLLSVGLLAALAITAPESAALLHAGTRRRLERDTAWDALWVGVMALCWTLGWGRVEMIIGSRWRAAGQAPLPSPPSGLADWLPGLSDWLTAPLHALWIAAFLGILLPTLWGWWRDPRRRGWAVAAVGLIWVGIFPAVHSPAQLQLGAIFSAVGLLLLFGFAHLFLRDNPLAYLSAALVTGLAGSGLDWLDLDVARAPAVAAALIATAVAWLVWLGLVSRKPAAGLEPAGR